MNSVRVLFAFTMLSLFSSSLAAQTLSGSVVSENGAALSNVSVTIPALQRKIALLLRIENPVLPAL